MALPRRRQANRVRITITVPKEFAEELRNAVYWTPGASVTSLMETATRGYLLELSSARGGPFPTRPPRPLRRGPRTRPRGEPT